MSQQQMGYGGINREEPGSYEEVPVRGAIEMTNGREMAYRGCTGLYASLYSILYLIK